MNEPPDTPRRPGEDPQHDPAATHPTGGHPQPPGGNDDRKRADRRRPLRRGRMVAAGVAVLVVLLGGAGAALLGGGGGEGRTSEAAARTPEAAAADEFVRCMRDHGIADFPDPDIEPDGSILFEGVADLGASSGQLQAAQAACEPILDEVRPAGPNKRQEIDPAAAGWEQIVPGGDCQCADGSEYRFYARAASPEKVVLYLGGGGACWSAGTCAPGGGNEYQTTVELPGGQGVFDVDEERNPLADHSFVFVPYCTGDVHLGNATTQYTADLTIQHKGYVNGTAALDYLAATFPDATEVVVIGASAGSVSAPLYAGLVSDRLPDARVTAIADSSGAYPDTPEFNAIAVDAWGVGSVMPDWPENAGLTAEEWSFPGLFVRSGRHDPGIVFARHDYAYDEEQASKLALAGVPVDDLLALIDANGARIEDAGVDLRSYVTPGDNHLALDGERFYTETVGGVALVDWVTRLVEGKTVDDVHCTDCTAG